MAAKICAGELILADINETITIRALSNGANQQGVRDHNERLILSVLQRNGKLAASEIAKRTHLSAQTISVIVRKLASDGLIKKGEPIKGKVGKPSIPVALNPDGALSFGFKLGRRSSELFLTNLAGRILFKRHITYQAATPDTVFNFLRESLAAAVAEIGVEATAKICGIGVAVPFEIWKWRESNVQNAQSFTLWQNVDIKNTIKEMSHLPVFIINDATSACWAEHIYGRGKQHQDYAYFFVSSFIGGGIVINQNVYEGNSGNAGALGAIRVGNNTVGTRQLVDVASLHLLERRMIEENLDPEMLWVQPQDWSSFDRLVEEWIDLASIEIAQACLSACAVVDFDTIIIDGAMPAEIRKRLVRKTRDRLAGEDHRGLVLPDLEAGSIGTQARAIGAACGPIYAQYFLNSRNRL